MLLVHGESQWVSCGGFENSAIQGDSNAIANFLDSCNFPETLSRDLGAYIDKEGYSVQFVSETMPWQYRSDSC